MYFFAQGCRVFKRGTTHNVGTTSGEGTAPEPVLPSPEERQRLREAAALTPEEVAAKVGVTATTVRSWESGRTNPRGRNRESYAAFLTALTAPDSPAAADTPASHMAEDSPGLPASPGSSSSPGSPASPGSAGSAGSLNAAGPRPHAGSPRPHMPQSSHDAPAFPELPGSHRHHEAPDAPASATSPAAPGAPDAQTTPALTEPHGSHQSPGTPADPEPRRSHEAPGTPDSLGSPDAPGVPDAADVAGGLTASSASPEVPGAQEVPEVPEVPRAQEAPEIPSPLKPPEAPALVPDFDALYALAAPALVRQVYLLTGRRTLSLEAVERAFHQAWGRWPEVVADPDPVGWVRATAYEYALSPWHRFRRQHRHPDKAPADPADRVLMDAMLALPPVHRRTVLLYDGIGLDLPDTAAETEATTPTTASRLLRAHAMLTARIPELAGATPERLSALLHHRLGALRPAVRLDPRPARAVRGAGEQRTRLRSRAVFGLTAAIAVATAYTVATAPTEYAPPLAPGTSVSGVPPLSGPQRPSEESTALHDKLRSDPAAGPARLAPEGE